MKQIQIIGNIGKDAEVKKFGDTEYTTFTVAVTEKVKEETVTTWFDCLKYGTNDKLRPYLLKGSKVFVQGNLSVKTSEKDGKTYTNINVNVSSLELIGSKSESAPAPQQIAPAQVVEMPAPIGNADESQLPF